MESRLQLRVQRYGWDKAAPHYERYWEAQLRPAQDRLLELAALRPGERVLDLACGTGLITFRAADAVGSSGTVVAADISQRMVEHIQTAASARAITHITARRAHAEESVLEAESFDAVLCGLGLMYVPDPRVALKEMRRALKRGGRAVVAVWGARARCGWADIFSIVDRRVQSEVCPMFFQLGTGETLRLHMEEAGFADVQVNRLSTILQYDSADDALGAAFAGGPVAMAYSRFDQPTREAAHAEYLESISSFARGDEYAIPGEFVVARGEARSSHPALSI
jgi:ubiquinone/menaquinone biosynthesis C-methylase UbiE